MSAEETLYAMLSGSSSLAGMVGQAVYPDAAPQDIEKPYVVFSRMSTEPVNTIHGANVGNFVSLHCVGWAATKSEAEAVGDAIVAALADGGEVPTGRTGDFDEDTGDFFSAIDVSLFVQ